MASATAPVNFDSCTTPPALPLACSLVVASIITPCKSHYWVKDRIWGVRHSRAQQASLIHYIHTDIQPQDHSVHSATQIATQTAHQPQPKQQCGLSLKAVGLDLWVCARQACDADAPSHLHFYHIRPGSTGGGSTGAGKCTNPSLAEYMRGQDQPKTHQKHTA